MFELNKKYILNVQLLLVNYIGFFSDIFTLGMVNLIQKQHEVNN
jgi:hypothetical protein